MELPVEVGHELPVSIFICEQNFLKKTASFCQQSSRPGHGASSNRQVFCMGNAQLSTFADPRCPMGNTPGAPTVKWITVARISE